MKNDWLEILVGDCRQKLAELPAGHFQTVVTSPPYFALRSYLPEGHESKGNEIGSEPTPAEFVATMVEVFRGVKRVLRDDGVLWVNLGDSYAANWNSVRPMGGGGFLKDQTRERNKKPPEGLKQKDLIGIPWRVALALQEDGWYLRDAIVWCLGASTRVYAKTQKGEMPMAIKDMIRLDPATVQLWNGDKWTQVIGWGKSRNEEPLQLILRSGERISCTPEHVFPVKSAAMFHEGGTDNVRASDLKVGDKLVSCRLPEPEEPLSPSSLPDELIGWFVGLYLAEGSRCNNGVAFAGHVDETEERMKRLKPIGDAFGFTFYPSKVGGKTACIRCKSLWATSIIDTYVGGKTARDKHLKVACWKRSDQFIRAVLAGYLHGDGHYDEKNDRWRLGFCRNYALHDDMRTMCARMGFSLRLYPSEATYNGERYETFRGELRFSRSTHHNSKDDNEIIEIRKAKGRNFVDIAVEDEPHLFALASGILTHNCKPAPMPGSQRDRCTSSYEYIFQLTLKPRYFFDLEAIKERSESFADHMTRNRIVSTAGNSEESTKSANGHNMLGGATRTPRNVWTIGHGGGFSGAHFATFPVELPIRCIKAATSERGCCPECGAPWERVVEKSGEQRDYEYTEIGIPGESSGRGRRPGAMGDGMPTTKTTGWRPTCDCHDPATPSSKPYSPEPCRVLDPFGGSGTTALAAKQLGRHCTLLELFDEYAQMAWKRATDPKPADVPRVASQAGQQSLFAEAT